VRGERLDLNRVSENERQEKWWSGGVVDVESGKKAAAGPIKRRLAEGYAQNF
jgi:hypothetical protein